MINIYEQIDRNKRRSTLIVVIFIVFVTLAVYILGEISGYGSSGVGFGLIFSGLMSFGSYFWSDKIILGISGAKPATKKDFFQFYTVVENLSLASQLPLPRLYVINDTAPNAFATGRDPNHAVVCATTGLLEKLNRSELEGVIGHELSHIRNYDVRLMSIVTILVGMVSLLGDWFLRSTRWGARRRSDDDNSGSFLFLIGIIFALISPIIAQLIQLAISRRREFFADASSAMITKYPSGLISALEKISSDKEPLEAANRATAHLYIVNPLKGEQITGRVANLFNTHPPIEQRIKALKEME